MARAKRHLHVFELASDALLVAMGLVFITGNESIIMGTASVSAPATPAPFVATAQPDPAVTCGSGVTPEAIAPGITPTLTSNQDAILTMLEFVSAGCPICQRMHTVVRAAEEGCSRHGIRVRQLDVATPEDFRQITTAVADGTIAALAAQKYLRES